MQFCGGESVEESSERINQLSKYNVGTIPDYSAEGKNADEDFDNTVSEIKKTIDASSENNNIPFSVFKVTGLGPLSILEFANAGLEKLSNDQKDEYNKIESRIDDICKYSFSKDVPIFIDAEDSWIQGTIDRIVEKMMCRYNQSKVIVYTTIQFYRWDRLEYLTKLQEDSLKLNYKLGIKLVRGAYMEKERHRAEVMGYQDPIQKTKKDTDSDFDKGLKFCVDHIDQISICAGTHNEKSSLYLTELLNSSNILRTDQRVYFSQLLGMSDHISFNLSNLGYNVAKYVPYGPVKEVIPYLIRRTEENNSVADQSGRELLLLKKELKRRQNNSI